MAQAPIACSAIQSSLGAQKATVPAASAAGPSTVPPTVAPSASRGPLDTPQNADLPLMRYADQPSSPNSVIFAARRVFTPPEDLDNDPEATQLQLGGRMR